MHVHFFLKVSVKESIFHIHLIKRPMANSSHSNETSDRCKVSNKSKCFLIVNAILLSKALGNYASLVSFNRSISLGLDLINSPTTYYRLIRRQTNEILSVILMMGIEFFIHNLLLKRINMGLMIDVRFIEDGKSKRAVIINEIRGMNAYPSGTTKFRTNKRLRRGWCH